VRARRWLITIIGAVSGVCFAFLAARAIGVLVITPNHYAAGAVTCAVVCACLSYASFRAGMSGRTDHASFQQAMVGGILGAFGGLVVMLLAYVFYRNGARAQFAHAVGLHFQQVTLGRLLAALVLLGFGGGFALRLPIPRKRRAGLSDEG